MLGEERACLLGQLSKKLQCPIAGPAADGQPADPIPVLHLDGRRRALWTGEAEPVHGFTGLRLRDQLKSPDVRADGVRAGRVPVRALVLSNQREVPRLDGAPDSFMAGLGLESMVEVAERHEVLGRVRPALGPCELVVDVQLEA